MAIKEQRKKNQTSPTSKIIYMSPPPPKKKTLFCLSPKYRFMIELVLSQTMTYSSEGWKFVSTKAAPAHSSICNLASFLWAIFFYVHAFIFV